MSLFPTEDKARKMLPMWKMQTRYFPKALREITRVCVANNVRYNPGMEPAEINWARGKSTDQLGSAFRHMMEAAVDGLVFEHTTPEVAKITGIDRVYVLAEAAWRVLAALELEIEAQESPGPLAKFMNSPDGVLPPASFHGSPINIPPGRWPDGPGDQGPVGPAGQSTSVVLPSSPNKCVSCGGTLRVSPNWLQPKGMKCQSCHKLRMPPCTLPPKGAARSAFLRRWHETSSRQARRARTCRNANPIIRQKRTVAAPRNLAMNLENDDG